MLFSEETSDYANLSSALVMLAVFEALSFARITRIVTGRNSSWCASSDYEHLVQLHAKLAIAPEMPQSAPQDTRLPAPAASHPAPPPSPGIAAEFRGGLRERLPSGRR
jgi:hypothetical protein